MHKSMDRKNYYRFIENIIKYKKKKSLYFKPDTGLSYSMDIHQLVLYTLHIHPELLNGIIDDAIDFNNLSLIDKNNIINYLKHQEKGTAFKYRDENGNTSGNDFKSLFRKLLVQTILQRDIERVYNRLEGQQKDKSRKTIKDFILKKKSPINNTCSAFEKNFKSLVREQGYSADSIKTAQMLIRTMNGPERNSLNKTFNALNVKNQSDLESVLAKWKYEAFTNTAEYIMKPAKSHNKTRHVESISY